MTDFSSSTETTRSPSRITNIPEEDGVGLSDPKLVAERRKMLDVVNRLHSTGVNTDVDLPMIAVIGSQSVGKSSLIESISGITLPRAIGTCTRCPTECKLSFSEEPWRCVVKLLITTDADGKPRDVYNEPFGPEITDKAEVEERIRRAQRAILNPNTKPRQYLEDDETDRRTQVSFSKNRVTLEISGPDVADLSFIDLPGLIVSVSNGGNASDIALVRDLVSSYIEKPSCVILLTVTCETDFENQGAHELAKEYDPDGHRTVGVLTKPDRISLGEEERWIELIKHREWYCVKQPAGSSMANRISWEEARKQEEDFFSSTEPWSSLEEVYQGRLYTKHLVNRLSKALLHLISERLPSARGEISTVLRDTEEEMRNLPKAPSNDPVGEVLQRLSAFTRIVSQNLEGTSDENGLLQTIRPFQRDFQRAIRSTAPNFQPWKKSDRENRQLPNPSFLEKEDGDGETSKKKNESSQKNVHSSMIYLDDVLNRAQKARTRELPDNFPFVVQSLYIKEFTQKWQDPAMHLLDRVHKTLATNLTSVIEEQFSTMGRGHVKKLVSNAVTDHLDEAVAITKEKVHWLLALENRPTTLNEHYYADYKDKFLSYYKGNRGGNDLVQKLEAYEHPKSAYDTGFNLAVSKITSSLSEIGINIKPIEIPRILAADPMEPALGIMAGVRGYFQVSYKRFVDMVPLAIDYEMFDVFGRSLEDTLRSALLITGPGAFERCRTLVEEPPNVATRREDLQQKLNRLHKARDELVGLGY
ncbi:P-loop containing nucleoside triphosphate hydrolase protein [Hygrophoropsis aurantiaca]|uniref:P-loop containing nucleoside triphosphate hydrolase protein n=1 Tax=Hygrophoropsis aurantiaca TaxID=72124 RepID=A0ACB8A448_9AGAM|nr:P-loop containing nucleoside triphosphate hydrolase protein [Hygrophoropsis aurantiaca]